MREIWWIQTIFGEKKLLSTAFLALDAAKYTYQRKKIYDLLKKSAIQGTSETAIVKGLIGLSFMNSPLVPYVYSDISTEDFIKNMPAFEKYGEYLVADNPSYGLGKLPYLFKKTDSFNTSKINFMSIHKSKGLSAHHVFIVGLVDGILPRGSESTNTLESQRRLFFVGASRAKQSLRLFSQMEWASSLIHKVDRSKFKYRGKDKVIGQTSPFVTELKLTN